MATFHFCTKYLCRVLQQHYGFIAASESFCFDNVEVKKIYEVK